MTERLLQFIWQFQYYNSASLISEEGLPLTIIHQGQYHKNQGPDFTDGKVIIDGTTWAGSIELHLRSSDWIRHHHDQDINYRNTILHVVWQHDAIIKHPDGSVIPTLELQHRVAKTMLQHYDVLQQSNRPVPCDRFLPALDNLKWSVWKDRLLVERLQQKSANIITRLQQARHHWEEVFWWMLARNFGSKINAECFEQVARTIPIATLAKHKNQIHQLECLLLGQAGLLQDNFTEAYMQLLQKEYNFLSKKYNLSRVSIPPHFLRMRPANFPTIRLAQLAMLIFNSKHLFSTIIEAHHSDEILKLLDVTANDYWHYHYLPGESTSFKPKQLGKQMAANIVINTVVPVVFAYAQYHKQDELKEKAMQWLTQLIAEENSITKAWKNREVPNEHAADSQALIELRNSYCAARRCLECAVGNKVLKTTSTTTLQATSS